MNEENEGRLGFEGVSLPRPWPIPKGMSDSSTGWPGAWRVDSDGVGIKEEEPRPRPLPPPPAPSEAVEKAEEGMRILSVALLMLGLGNRTKVPLMAMAD